MKFQKLREEIAYALKAYRNELPKLRTIADMRYDRMTFPTTGQYDWFCAQVLYALIRHRRPEQVETFE